MPHTDRQILPKDPCKTNLLKKLLSASSLSYKAMPVGSTEIPGLLSIVSTQPIHPVLPLIPSMTTDHSSVTLISLEPSRMPHSCLHPFTQASSLHRKCFLFSLSKDQTFPKSFSFKYNLKIHLLDLKVENNR